MCKWGEGVQTQVGEEEVRDERGVGRVAEVGSSFRFMASVPPADLLRLTGGFFPLSSWERDGVMG